MKLEIVFKDGRKETFDSVASYNVTEEQAPTEGKLFEVNPLGIDRSKFEKHMTDRRQERTRQIIQEAFAEVDKHPEEYASAFYTLIPEKKWDGAKNVVELESYAKDAGGLMADWVEQALEWAQRIFNGESWEAICNNADTAKWYRTIRCKNGCYRLVGGSRNNYKVYPASYVHCYHYYYNGRFNYTVPLVRIEKK